MLLARRLGRWLPLVGALSILAALLSPPLASAATAGPAMAYIAAPAVGADPQLFWRPDPDAAPVQLTSDGASHAGLAPDGSFIFTHRFTASGLDIYKVDTATKASTQVTNLPGDEWYPEVSPDGRNVAFFHQEAAAGGGSFSVQVLDLATGVLSVVSSPDITDGGPPVQQAPAWSRDGTKLAYQASADGGASTSVVVVNFDGTGRKVITTGPSGHCAGAMAWTPDNAYVLCTHDDVYQIFAVSVATGESVQITHESADIKPFDPQVDNDWTLYFDSLDANGTGHIYQTSLADPSVNTRVFNLPGGEFGPSIAPYGPVQPTPAGFLAAVESITPPPDPTPTPPPPVKPPGYECGTVKLFGVRGSGEKPHGADGLGKTIDDFKDRLALVTPGLSFEAIDYPAIPVNLADPLYAAHYLVSMTAGEETLLKSLHDFLAYCPHTYAILAGYSQGAQAAGNVYEQLTDTERSHVASLVLFGDPLFNPAQPAVDAGNFDPALSGVMAVKFGFVLRQIPPGFTSSVRSYCTAGDPVCGYSLANASSCSVFLKLGFCAHLSYVRLGYTMSAAAWVASRRPGLPQI